jgi:hypothetical protein
LALPILSFPFEQVLMSVPQYVEENGLFGRGVTSIFFDDLRQGGCLLFASLFGVLYGSYRILDGHTICRKAVVA